MKERKVVLHGLVKVINQEGYANIILRQILNDELNKPFMTHLFYGVIQNKIYLDYLLKPVITTKMKSRARIILAMALYEHIFMDKTPNYAIINEYVELTKQETDLHSSKQVNAILQKVFKEKVSLDQLSEVEQLAIKTSHPLNLVKMLIKQYDLETAIQILNQNNKPPLNTIRVNTLKTTRVELKNEIESYEGRIGKNCLIVNQGNLASLDAFKQGKFLIQDEASQLVAEFMNPKKGSRVLDMTAAPGSKTCNIAMMMDNKGEIIACDIHEHKLPLIEENALRLGIDIIKTKCVDARLLASHLEPESFDYILLDAPCSGLGVIQRKPDMKLKDIMANIDPILQIQKELLDQAILLLKPNGQLVYSTCTVNKKENHKQIEAFIKRHPEMQLLDQKQILNFEYNTDGFYMAKLVKTH